MCNNPRREVVSDSRNILPPLLPSPLILIVVYFIFPFPLRHGRFVVFLPAVLFQSPLFHVRDTKPAHHCHLSRPHVAS